MNLWASLFLAIGVAAFTYSKMSRRTGYGNTQSIIGLIAIAFVLTWIFAYTLFRFVLHMS